MVSGNVCEVWETTVVNNLKFKGWKLFEHGESK